MVANPVAEAVILIGGRAVAPINPMKHVSAWARHKPRGCLRRGIFRMARQLGVLVCNCGSLGVKPTN